MVVRPSASPATRRSFLRRLAPAVAVGFGGCFGGQSPESPREIGGPRTETTEPDEPPPRTPRQTPSDPIRCRGEPVAVERAVEDQPGYGDNIKYFPSNETVRFVAARSGDEPARFGTWSFAEWGRIKSAEAAHERVRAVTADRVGSDEFGSSIGNPPPGADVTSPVVHVVSGTTLDREGDIVSTPAVRLPTLTNSAPRSVDATVSIEGDAFSRSVPVFGRATVSRLL